VDAVPCWTWDHDVNIRMIDIPRGGPPSPRLLHLQHSTTADR